MSRQQAKSSRCGKILTVWSYVQCVSSPPSVKQPLAGESPAQIESHMELSSAVLRIIVIKENACCLVAIAIPDRLDLGWRMNSDSALKQA